MKRILIYTLVYFIIIYEVYFIFHFLNCYGGFEGAFIALIFLILHTLLFISFLYKFSIIKILNKFLRFIAIVLLSTFPSYLVSQTVINSSPRFENKLNELSAKIEKYRKRNGHYPKSFDAITSPINRFVSFPYYFLPFPKYIYKYDSKTQQYSMRVYEDWDGCYIISSTDKKAKWLED